MVFPVTGPRLPCPLSTNGCAEPRLRRHFCRGRSFRLSRQDSARLCSAPRCDAPYADRGPSWGENVQVLPCRKREFVSQKLFVGNLAFATSEALLRETFEQYGEVSEVRCVVDRDTGRSRGFGFVTMGSAEDARRAMQELDGSTLDGREIRVNEAEQRRDGGGGGGRGGFSGGGGGGGGRGGSRGGRDGGRGGRDDRW